MKNLILQTNRVIFLVNGVVVFVPTLIYSNDLKVGDQAPILLGFNAKDGRRLNLYRIITELSFKRNKEGKYIVGADKKLVSEFTKNVVVLNFFSKSCIPCIREIPTLNRMVE